MRVMISRTVIGARRTELCVATIASVVLFCAQC
jgi:hypothetical protein